MSTKPRANDRKDPTVTYAKSRIALCLFLVALSTCASERIFLTSRSSAESRMSNDSSETISAGIRNSVRQLRKQAETEHAPAIQFGKLHGTVATVRSDEHWYGDLHLSLSATYTATYGIPFDLVERGLRIETDDASKAIYAIVATPRPLLVAVDTHSIRVTRRRRTGIRFYSKQDALQIAGTRELTDLARQAAANTSRTDAAMLKLARKTVHGIVVDCFGLTYDNAVKRDVAQRLVVVFEHELDRSNRQRLAASPRERTR